MACGCGGGEGGDGVGGGKTVSCSSSYTAAAKRRAVVGAGGGGGIQSNRLEVCSQGALHRRPLFGETLGVVVLAKRSKGRRVEGRFALDLFFLLFFPTHDHGPGHPVVVVPGKKAQRIIRRHDAHRPATAGDGVREEIRGRPSQLGQHLHARKVQPSSNNLIYDPRPRLGLPPP